MSTGAVPSHASVKARRAASYAGPVASIAVASPVSTTVKVSSAPHGTWALTAAQALDGVGGGVTGAIRIETLARAVGTSVLLAPSTCGASRPATLSEGLVQSRSTTEPSPIHCTSAVAPDSARSRSSG